MFKEKVINQKIYAIFHRSILMVFLIFTCVGILYDISIAGSIQPHIFRMGANPKVGDIATLAKFNIIVHQRKHWDDAGGSLFDDIRAINPKAKIFVYFRPILSDSAETANVAYVTSTARWDMDRGHSMGDVHQDNYDLVLKNDFSEITQTGKSTARVMDFGNSVFQTYALEVFNNDYINQKWGSHSNGIFGDLMPSVNTSTVRAYDFNTTADKYNTASAWTGAMNNFIDAMSNGLSKNSKLFGMNYGQSNKADGYNAWIALDSKLYPPYFALEEGAFSTIWGTGTYDVQFYSEEKWKRQVDILANISNYNVLFISNSAMPIGGSGTDNYGKSVTMWQAFYFSMGSYLLGKNDTLNNGYWAWIIHPYTALNWFDEYDLDIGRAIGSYKLSNYGGKNIYWREFTKGYVYVNPNKDDVPSISLPENCALLTHSNFKKDPALLLSIDEISLKGHRAAFLLKTTYGKPKAMSSPINFRKAVIEVASE